MKKYEMMVILKPMLPEDIRSGVMQRLEKIIIGHKGKVIKSDIWGKRHLAYPIKKHEEGYYIIYTMEMPAEAASELQKEIKLLPDVLRFLNTVLD